LSSAGEDGSIVLWDVEARQRLGRLFKYARKVYSMAFNRDGKHLVSGHRDGSVILWDVGDVELWQARACHIANRNLAYRNGDDDEWNRYMGDEPYRPTCPGLPPDPFREIEKRYDEELKKLENKPGGELARSSQELRQWRRRNEDLRVGDAVALFGRSRKLAPDLADLKEHQSEPIMEAKLMVGEARKLFNDHKVTEALAAYTSAQRVDPKLTVSAEPWDMLCRRGSLSGHATEVMYACEQAVKLDPENGAIRDSRGLARALTGNTDGAVEDFQAFIDWAEIEELRS